MKTSVLDFIDSDTLREHLRNQTLEPAVECILIVRSRRCSIEKKLEALKERYDTYSKEDFNKGTYYCREKDDWQDGKYAFHEILYSLLSYLSGAKLHKFFDICK